MAFNTVFKGNTSGSIASIPLNIPCNIKSYTLVNTTVGSITVNLYISSNEDGSSVRILEKDKSIAAGAIVEKSIDIKVLPKYAILITTSGELDYYFSLSSE